MSKQFIVKSGNNYLHLKTLPTHTPYRLKMDRRCLQSKLEILQNFPMEKNITRHQ
jgi:hypothetical protein